MPLSDGLTEVAAQSLSLSLCRESVPVTQSPDRDSDSVPGRDQAGNARGPVDCQEPGPEDFLSWAGIGLKMGRVLSLGRLVTVARALSTGPRRFRGGRIP